MRLELDCPDDMRVLRKEDVLAVLQDPGRPARRPRRDRRHRQPRQPPGPFGRRAAGKPVPRRPAAHGARDQGAHELGRYRHGHAARPDQRQAGRRRGARVLRLVAAVAVHGPDQPAVGNHPQAPPLGAWPGRSDPRARRLRSPRRAPDPLRPHLPDRDAGRPEHRPDQLAGHPRAWSTSTASSRARTGASRTARRPTRWSTCRPWKRRSTSSPRPTSSSTNGEIVEDLVPGRINGEPHAAAARPTST